MAAEQAGARIADWAQGLRVGVTGHRLARLDEADLGALAASVHDVLARIDVQLSQGPPRHLISSLAEGADSIVADAALALDWRLDVVLPLPSEDYALDFAPGEPRDVHRRRIAAANALFELPAEPADPERAAAYERAGRVVLAQSDIILTIWDGQPARGRGGTAQIIAEAVLRGIPVIHIDPAALDAGVLLWDGLDEHDFGQQSVETVARAGLERVHEVVAHLTRRPDDAQVDPLASVLLSEIEQPQAARRHRSAIAYPLLLTVMGVRPVRLLFRRRPPPPPDTPPAIAGEQTHDDLTRWRLTNWFERADTNAVAAGQTFRSAYVTNYALAALAVIVSLAGLALPHEIKPLLATIELGTIATVLAITRIGRRGNWHRRWLDQRHLAERLRCMLIANRLGELGLRRGRAAEGNWVNGAMHAVARMAGLPSARVDEAYLGAVRDDLLSLIDGQIRYLDADAVRMHTLEHRMHRVGTALFGATALICLTMVVLELAGAMEAEVSEHGMHVLSLAATIASAALPACGAAIYGIRMQSDFAGIAERGTTLASKLRALRALVRDDPLRFDVLSRRVARATDLMTDDLSTWLHTYRARPLALPG